MDDGDTGAAYVFRREGDAWVEQAKLMASDAAENDYFGSSVSISGDYALVGAQNESAYIFELEEGEVTALPDTFGSALTLFPNPAGETLQVSLRSESGETIKCVVYDLTGRDFFTKTFAKSSESTAWTLDLSGLPAGLYLLEVAQGEMHSVRRFVKR